MMKKEPKTISLQLTSPVVPINSGNQDYVYLTFRKGFTAWKQGSHLLKSISDLLHLEPETFSEGRYVL